MKLRLPPILRADLEARADLMETSNAEMIRRSIRRYVNAVDSGRCVALGENEEPATRENSTPAEYDLGAHDGKILHRDVLRIVRWALDDSKPELVELSQEAKKEAEWLRKKKAELEKKPWRK